MALFNPVDLLSPIEHSFDIRDGEKMLTKKYEFD